MKHTDAIKKILKENNLTQLDVATALELNTPSTISRLLNRDGGRVARIIDILDVIGYELAVRPKTKGDWPDEYVLTLQDYRESD